MSNPTLNQTLIAVLSFAFRVPDMPPARTPGSERNARLLITARIDEYAALAYASGGGGSDTRRSNATAGGCIFYNVRRGDNCGGTANCFDATAVASRGGGALDWGTKRPTTAHCQLPLNPTRLPSAPRPGGTSPPALAP
jgi:hypothetical protein